MDEIIDTNECTASTTWAWRKVKIGRPPEAKAQPAAGRPKRPRLHPWDRNKPMTIVVKYRGGPECWVEVRARGRIFRRHGATAVYDLLCELYGYPLK